MTKLQSLGSPRVYPVLRADCGNECLLHISSQTKPAAAAAYALNLIESGKDQGPNQKIIFLWRAAIPGEHNPAEANAVNAMDLLTQMLRESGEAAEWALDEMLVDLSVFKSKDGTPQGTGLSKFRSASLSRRRKEVE